MDSPGGDSKTHLTWANVGLGLAFIAFDALVSHLCGLGVGVPLVTSAVRCIVQLSIVAIVLQKIFEANNPWGVAGIAGGLSLLCYGGGIREADGFGTPCVLLCHSSVEPYGNH